MNEDNQSQLSPIEKDEFWRKHYEKQQSSGLSRAMYCRQYELNYHYFCYWVKKQKTPINNGLISVKLKSDILSAPQQTLCTLDLKNGHSLKIHDAQILIFILEKFV